MEYSVSNNNQFFFKELFVCGLSGPKWALGETSTPLVLDTMVNITKFI